MALADSEIAVLAAAVAARQKLPKFSQAIPMAEAYAQQDKLLAHMACDLAGIKAGLSNAGVQKFFALEEAVVARLYADGLYQSGAKLSLRPGTNLECELAIKVAADGTPLAIAPAIEVVYLELEDNADMTAGNIVAANLGADRFVLGEFQTWQGNYGDLSVELKYQDEICNKADMTASLGGAEPALSWMLGKAAENNWPIKDNTILLTGTCGKAVPAQSGVYEADYGRLGTIRFSFE